jgi:dolichol-phosphate mannosyltransferase
VNAAISGVSAFIDPQGRVVSATELFETDILRGTVRPSSGRTPYVGLGDLLPLLGAVVAVGLFLMPRRRIRARAPADPLPERPRVLVIVPTFDERATIERLITGVLDRDQDVAVLVVDDASPDGTAAIVRGLASADPRIRLLERPSKSGLASAYLEGFGLGLGEGFDLIVEMDADLSHDPGEFDRLLAGASRFDLTIGSRYVEGGAVTNWSRGRLALSRAGNLYARFMLGFPIHDATSGYRIYRKELLADVLARPIASEGYGFQVELALRSWRLGYRVGEVPITFRDRQHGTSKISRRIVVEALWLITVWGLSARFGHGEDLEPADEA